MFNKLCDIDYSRHKIRYITNLENNAIKYLSE